MTRRPFPGSGKNAAEKPFSQEETIRFLDGKMPFRFFFAVAVMQINQFRRAVEHFDHHGSGSSVALPLQASCRVGKIFSAVA